jgi:hypothetical protein
MRSGIAAMRLTPCGMSRRENSAKTADSHSHYINP